MYQKGGPVNESMLQLDTIYHFKRHDVLRQNIDGVNFSYEFQGHLEVMKHNDPCVPKK